MKRFISFTGLVLLLGLFVGTTWFLYQKSQEDPVIYETDAPYVTDIINKTVAIGSITPRREVSIKSQVSGVVDELYVEPGQSVESGDLIARIRLIPNMEHLNQAQSQQSEEHTSELQSRGHLVCRLLLENKNTDHI